MTTEAVRWMISTELSDLATDAYNQILAVPRDERTEIDRQMLRVLARIVEVTEARAAAQGQGLVQFDTDAWMKAVEKRVDLAVAELARVLELIGQVEDRLTDLEQAPKVDPVEYLAEVTRINAALESPELAEDPASRQATDFEIPTIEATELVVMPPEIDWDKLRKIVRAKVQKDYGGNMAQAGKDCGYISLDAFLRGKRTEVPALTLVRLMLWAGYHDVREFCKTI